MRNLLLLLAAATLFGCGSNTNTNEFSIASVAEDAPPMARMAADSYAPSEKTIEQSPEQNQTAGQQKIIRNAHISIEVENYEESRPKLDSIVRIHKGWISSENLNNYEYRITNYITIRVPSASLDPIINDLHSIAKRIESQSIQSTDVTEEYIDIESRLKNQREVEKKFIGLLKRTDSIDEILRIESKLAEVRSQIESIEGRLRYLNNRIDYSTVNLNIYQKIDFKFVPEPMESFWERLKTSIHKGWKGFVSFILFLIRLWPLLIIGSLATYAFTRYRKNRSKPSIIKRKAKRNNKKSTKPSKVSDTN
ncbi:DUF4349 domain-containing protein [Perlabentimonas gracilis]|jgi:hypothetical protein|uniref:DUF4349 domain-containing protein n=1 Tax=Perlabentimonas gracilis TaxID=2715279 RepID=UPI00140A6391|nr:DUF4349 domain-containing protein [Perlabentimonas gracilis]NHB67563.1 DUF4349 domain-containing protein [Perlabentimonas gracilis]